MPFKKGQSGNPNGRPRKQQAITPILEKLGKEKGKLGITNYEQLCRVIWARALAGDISFVSLVYNRVDGKEPDIFVGDIDHNINVEKKIKELSQKTPDEVIAELTKEIQADS